MAQPLGLLSTVLETKPTVESDSHYLIIHADTVSKVDDFQYMVPVSSVKGVVSNPTGITGASAVTNIVTMSQAAYDALPEKNSSTVYIIV